MRGSTSFGWLPPLHSASTWPSAGYVFSSTDRGAHWARTSFSRVPMDANDSYRTSGEKMAVDPINPDVVYLGTQSNGLWVTTTGGRAGCRRATFQPPDGSRESRSTLPVATRVGSRITSTPRVPSGGRLSHPRRRCDLDLDSRRAIRRCDARQSPRTASTTRCLLRASSGSTRAAHGPTSRQGLSRSIPSRSTPRLLDVWSQRATARGPRESRQRSHVAIRLVLPGERQLPGRPVALLRVSGRWSRQQQPDVRPRGGRETLDDCRHDPLVCTAAGRVRPRFRGRARSWASSSSSRTR